LQATKAKIVEGVSDKFSIFGMCNSANYFETSITQILVGKSESEKPLGRLRRGREGNIKIYLGENRVGAYGLDSLSLSNRISGAAILCDSK
jgi:hypothetical protein